MDFKFTTFKATVVDQSVKSRKTNSRQFTIKDFMNIARHVFIFLNFSPEPQVSVLVGVALSSFPIGAINTVGGSADPTHLAQREVICPALMLWKLYCSFYIHITLTGIVIFISQPCVITHGVPV